MFGWFFIFLSENLKLKIEAMKTKSVFLVSIVCLVLFSSCADPFYAVNPLSETAPTPPDDEVNDDDFGPEPYLGDHHLVGGTCVTQMKDIPPTKMYPIQNLPDSLPPLVDLSSDMPPVRSQGPQGSCVAWSSVYYLKSYQEKIQHKYEYSSFSHVMSPSYIYNQTKVRGSCKEPSSFEACLELMKTQGVLTWKDFPYVFVDCERKPTMDEVRKAAKIKIKDYYYLEIPDTLTDSKYTMIKLMKSLLHKKTPVMISIDWFNVKFGNILQTNDVFIYDYEKVDPAACGHAVLVVGYDDEKKAFKFVNSWGNNWGNKGYAYMLYDFFRAEDDPEYKKGLWQRLIAFDTDD